MGLLDDAIKEHLDLKRRRGADPAEVERDEREALGPVRRAPESPPEGDEDQGSFAYDQEQEESSWSHDSFEDEPESESADVDRIPEFLDDEPRSHRRAATDLDDEPFAGDEPFADDDDEADDEFESGRGHADPDSRSSTPAPHRAGGEETAEYDVEEALGSEKDEHEVPGGQEDVLEETPEFLQDTPDHDRLWFEQRPPKDFDFDG